MASRLLQVFQPASTASSIFGLNPTGIWRSASSLMQSLASTSATSCPQAPDTCSLSTNHGSLSWSARLFSSQADAHVGLSNLRDNPGATRQRIRVGRGDAARRGNYSGRGLKGQKARSGSGPHPLFDGGQLGLLKFPISREKPPYEVLYKQLGLPRLIEYVQLGLLDATKVITMKDLYDTGCIQGKIRYGVQLYGKAPGDLRIPLQIQITACTDESRDAISRAGGSVQRVYYTAEGITALINPGKYTRKKLPLPPPAHSWHPRYNDKFDKIGQLPPRTLRVHAAAAVVKRLPPPQPQKQQQRQQQ